MSKGQLHQIHPVLPVRNVVASQHYYVEKLGFAIAFSNDEIAPNYGGVRRDSIEIHLQSHTDEEWNRMTSASLRFVVTHIEKLFNEYKTAGVFHSNTVLKETSWGTREFAFYDIDMNGLTFYQEL